MPLPINLTLRPISLIAPIIGTLEIDEPLSSGIGVNNSPVI